MSDHSTVSLNDQTQVQFSVGNDNYGHYVVGDRVEPFGGKGVNGIYDGVGGDVFWWVVIVQNVIVCVSRMLGQNRVDEPSMEALLQLARLEQEHGVSHDLQ